MLDQVDMRSLINLGIMARLHHEASQNTDQCFHVQRTFYNPIMLNITNSFKSGAHLRSAMPEPKRVRNARNAILSQNAV